MSESDIAFIEAVNCFSFATQIWGSKQSDKYEEANRAYEMGMKIYREKFIEKNTCEEKEFEF